MSKRAVYWASKLWLVFVCNKWWFSWRLDGLRLRQQVMVLLDVSVGNPPIPRTLWRHCTLVQCAWTLLPIQFVIYSGEWLKLGNPSIPIALWRHCTIVQCAWPLSPIQFFIFSGEWRKLGNPPIPRTLRRHWTLSFIQPAIYSGEWLRVYRK